MRKRQCRATTAAVLACLAFSQQQSCFSLAFAPSQQSTSLNSSSVVTRQARKRGSFFASDYRSSSRHSTTEDKQESSSALLVTPESSNKARPSSSSLPGAAWVQNKLTDPFMEVSGSLLVLLSCTLAALQTLDGIIPFWQVILDDVQNFIAYTFCAEFFCRWYASSKGFFRYLTQPLVLVDLVVVILPLALPMLTGMPPWLTSRNGLINLRLLRILRLQRVLADLNTFTNFTQALGLGGQARHVQPYQLQLARVVLSIFTLLSVSSGLIYTAEHAVNPNMDNYFSALYFGLTTLTTVGFGDIVPVTSEGKLVVCGSILAGVAIIPAQAASLVEALLSSQQSREEKESTSKALPSNKEKLPASAVDAATPCPSCGATFHWNSANFCWSCGGKL